MQRKLIVIGLVVAAFASACGGGSDATGTVGTTAAGDQADVGDDANDDTGATDTADRANPTDPPDHLARSVGAWNTDWSMTTIDTSELALGLGGSDPRDGIPPIDDPQFESLDEAASWLDGNQPGSAVEVDGEARFYPLAILTAHEIVNDRFGDRPIAVTFCPLCNTALAFDRVVDGTELRFGVSGMLRKSDLVMWDDVTDSLWQQITGEGIVGTYAGTELTVVPSSIVSFEQFSERYPDGVSLDPESGGGDGAYGRNPYVGYSSQSAPFSTYFTEEVDDRYPSLERVVGISLDGRHKAYPFSLLATETVVNDEIGGTPIAVFWGGDTADALDASSIADSASIGSAVAHVSAVDGERLTFSVRDGRITDDQTGSEWSVLGEALSGELAGATLETAPHRNEFWFAWSGFFPDGEVYEG